MASIDTQISNSNQKIGIKKRKKASTQIDMTPMVDLGFLLITFFIFTTTLTQPTAMNLFLPKDAQNESEKTFVKESGAFSILLGEANKIYYYEGIDPSKIKKTDWKKLRELIIDKKNQTPKEDLVILIKPSERSDYGNLINMLDEMVIHKIEKYTMLDLSNKEREWISKI